MNKQKIIALCVSLWLAVSGVNTPDTSAAAGLPQTTTPSPPVVVETEAGVSVEWHNNSTAARRNAADWSDWHEVEINGLLVPAHQFTLVITDPALFATRVEQLTSRGWTARRHPFQAAPARIPRPVDEDERPDLAPAIAAQLPAAPLVELRRARVRGVELAVMAVVPLYQSEGSIQQVTDLHVTLAGARVMTETASLGLTAADARAWRLDGQIAAPSPQSRQPALKVFVQAEGIQAVPLPALINAGLVETSDDLPQLHLTYGGEPVAVEVTTFPDGVLRFYAPPPGDRWNDGDVYWITVGETAGLRMAQRDAVSSDDDDLPVQAWAWAQEAWYAPTRYDSTMAGPDGDHWFAADLRSGPDLISTPVTLTLPPALPPLSASASFTLTGAAYTAGNHALVVASKGQDQKETLTWSGTGNWSQTFSLPGDLSQLFLSLAPSQVPDGVQIDRLTWTRPVSLTFGGGSAAFVTAGERRVYQLDGVPANALLYEVTDPRRPVRIAPTSASDGELLLASEGEQRYLLTATNYPIYLPLIGTNTPAPDRTGQQTASSAVGRRSMPVQHPIVQRHRPVNWTSALNADVLYLAPARLSEPLLPLVAQRQARGYNVAVVDTQAIYDGWNGGLVSPQAIRDFLRYAATKGERAPIAVTLIGDGTSDPLDYTGRGNINFVPPYLAVVDPWVGETACETCYAQLDGENPLDDSLPDLMIGRLPVKSSQELSDLVEKLLTYEANRLAPRDSFAFYVTDNYRHVDGSVDSAGNFVISAEESIALHPPGMAIERLYYDPTAEAGTEPWFEADAVSAYKRTLDALDRGAGFVNYIGHAHHWQWASTDLNADPAYLFGLYDPDLLKNRDSLSILLEMTCLTGAFQTPAFSGTTIDERFLLNKDGGSVAVWASTGFGVGHGHDALQHGFYTTYWAQPDRASVLGELVQGGYVNLFSNGRCCQDTLRTFVLLGDPLTLPQVEVSYQMQLPFVQN